MTYCLPVVQVGLGMGPHQEQDGLITFLGETDETDTLLCGTTPIAVRAFGSGVGGRRWGR